jgi:hypothetical protein
LTASGETALAVSVQLSGFGGYDPGTVFDRSNRLLSAEEWSQVRDALTHASFWVLRPQENSAGLDGAQWIIEGRAGAKYHVVDRWSPTAGPVRELGLLFLKVARFTVPASEIY